MILARQLREQGGGGPTTNPAVRKKQSYAEACERRWAPLLEDVADYMGSAKTNPRHVKATRQLAAMLIEREVEHIRNLDEATRALSLGPYIKHVLPVIKRAAVRLVATRIASVQPMSGPIDGIAFWKPVYASNKGSVTAGTEMNKSLNKWYTSNFIDGEPFASGDGLQVQFAKALDQPKVIAGTVQVKVDGVLVGTDNGGGAIVPAPGSTLAAGLVSYASGQLSLTFSAPPASGAAITVEYRYDNELTSRIPTIRIDVELRSIEAESRKIKSVASLESLDDARTLWNRNLDDELQAHMADELAAEIDREIAGTALRGVEDVAVVKWDRSTPSGISDHEHVRSLLLRMSRASHIVLRRGQRRQANYCITSSEVAALLNNIEGFTPVDDGHMFTGGIVQHGVLSRQWTVFVDPDFPANQILMAYQGDSMLDTGIIWSPYVLMEATQPFVNPDDQSIVRSMRTRHKVSLVRPEFFARVEIDNLF